MVWNVQSQRSLKHPNAESFRMNPSPYAVTVNVKEKLVPAVPVAPAALNAVAVRTCVPNVGVQGKKFPLMSPAKA